MAAPNLMVRRRRQPPPPPVVVTAMAAPPLSAFLLLLPLLLGLGPGPVSGGLGSCRCLPHSECWPSPDTWQQLNVSIGGHLLAPTPPALPCHSTSTATATATAACRATIQNWNNPFWRADQPGAMQYTNREAYGNQSCFLSNPNSTAPHCDDASTAAFSDTTRSSSERGCCFQGAVPPYAVEAHNASHVQAAIRFAAVHNLRLSIKSTGHDIMGRSTAPGSLNLWMHRLKHITFHDDDDAPFVPAGCPINSASASYAAVTVGAGTQWQEVYEAADEKKVVVVGSMSASVSVGGGYLQGGGHSPLSPLLGLAADQVLEMSVVTADGQLRRASPCQNADLFWALRGGGGGTYGAVVSTTHKTFPALQGLVGVFMLLFTASAPRFQELLTVFLQMQASMVEQHDDDDDDGHGRVPRWAGYSYMTTPNGGYALTLNFLLPNASTAPAAEAYFAPLYAYAARHSADLAIVNNTIRVYFSFREWHTSVLCSAFPGLCTDACGTNAAVSSRLLPAARLRERTPNLAAALVQILAAPGIVQIIGHLVGGGAVSRTHPDTNSVNPAWRAAAWHVTVVSSWQKPGDAAASFEMVTRVNRLLRDLSPGSGAYLNEADVNEPDWQQSFFGSHYDRLKAIKRLYDPRGLFTCVNCVGSEDWSDDLNCYL